MDKKDMPHKDGEIITAVDGTQEKIKYDYDKKKNLIGWHKIAVKKGK